MHNDLEATEKLMPRAIQGTMPEVKHQIKNRLTQGKPDTLAGMVRQSQKTQRNCEKPSHARQIDLSHLQRAPAEQQRLCAKTY